MTAPMEARTRTRSLQLNILGSEVEARPWTRPGLSISRSGVVFAFLRRAESSINPEKPGDPGANDTSALLRLGVRSTKNERNLTVLVYGVVKLGVMIGRQAGMEAYSNALAVFVAAEEREALAVNTYSHTYQY